VITAEIINGKQAPRAMRNAMAVVDSALERAVVKLAIKMTALVKQKLSGEVLNVRTNRLRGSIHYEIQKGDNSVTATVGTNVVYAKTHELGLTIPAHIVQARRGAALKFQMGGKVMFRKRVTIPAVKMPKRSFLEASLRQMAPEIQATLADEVAGDMRKLIMEGVK
jgi:phage gpG-like protein